MSSRARAPQTAHLRKTILKVAKKHSHHVSTSKRQVNLLGLVRNGPLHHWHDVTEEQIACESVDLYERPPPHLNVDVHKSVEDDRSKRLCEILSQIAAQFRNEGDLYCAAAATAAICMVKAGRQDDINPGLWPHINLVQSSSAGLPST